MNKKEVRSFVNTGKLEARASGDGKKRLRGTAIVFNSRSQDLGGFVEVISTDALTRTLRESPDVLHLRDHDSSKLLGRTTAGTTALTVDSKGLHFETVLPDTEIGNDTWENCRLRNLTGNSFGMIVTKDDWKQLSDGTLLRTVLDLDLLEISTTSFPAYQATSVDARAIRSQIAKRDAGDAQDVDDISDSADADASDDEVDFTLCDDCRAKSCAICQRNFRSKVGLDGLPVRACTRCLRAWCDRCADRYSALTEDDPSESDARSQSCKLASLLLRMAAQ